PNGTYAIPIEAYDRAGNNNTTQTGTLDLAIADREKPSITDANAVDLDDGDGNVTALDRILLNATATDAGIGIANVTANASAFGAGVVTLTDPDGDDVYNATITVDADEAAPNGSYSVPVTAKDAAGNENTTTTNALQLNVSDRVAPNVTNFSVRVTDTRALDVSFDSNEALSTVNLTVTDLATDTRVRTLSLADFGTVGGSYSNQTVLDSAGRYRIDLVTAADASGNDGSGDANATVKLITRTVTVAHRDGPAPDMANVTANVYLTQDSSGLLQIQLRDAAGAEFSDRTDLSDLGVEPNTTLAVNVTVKNWTPRLLLGAARNATWNVTAVDADTTTINVTADPADVQYNETQLNGTTRNWSETDTADFGSNATVDLAVSDLSGFDAARRDRFDGTMLLTDAQAFGTPRYNTSTDALSLYVAAPHLNESGGQNRGFFDAFLPTAVLNDWGVSDPASIDVSALGTAATPAETATTSEGVRLEIPIHYSAGDVELAPDSTAPSIMSPSITDATDGDGTVADGDRIRVSATVTDATSGVASVSADASPFGAGTVWLSDSDTDGDDVYTGSFTVDGGAIGSDGSYSVSVSATDVAGNTGSKSTNALRFDSADGGGGDSGSGGDGGDGGSGGSGADGGGGGAPLPPQTATPTPTPTPIPTPEPRVRVARTADGASVTIERASAGRTVAAELGDATTSSIAGVTGLRVKPSVDVTNFSVSLTPPTRTTADAPALPGGSAVGYFRADAVGLPNDRIASASLRFTVPESSLPAGATPDRVRLYRYHDGEWQRLETTYLGDGVYEASTPGFSVFAIGADEASDGGGTGRSGSVATGDGTDGAGDDGGGSTGGSGATAAASTATTESGGASPGPGTSGGSTPGFGAAVAVLAILLTAGGAARWTGESRT
ncbi:MAG: PGF-pre-PGF domain-containing protein, partial [Halobellus sp.]